MHEGGREEAPELALPYQAVGFCEERDRKVELKKELTRQLQKVNEDCDTYDCKGHIGGGPRQGDANDLLGRNRLRRGRRRVVIHRVTFLGFTR